MVDEHYSNQQIVEISGASAVVHWKSQYLAEKKPPPFSFETILH